MRIGITGVEGLLGWHTRCFLHTRPDVVVVGADRQTFANVTGLDDFVRQCDWIIHLAGMNRGDDNEIYATNVQLTEMLVSACERGKVVPHIVFSSSAHIARDTPYARSKRRCAEILEAY